MNLYLYSVGECTYDTKSIATLYRTLTSCQYFPVIVSEPPKDCLWLCDINVSLDRRVFRGTEDAGPQKWQP